MDLLVIIMYDGELLFKLKIEGSISEFEVMWEESLVFIY